MRHYQSFSYYRPESYVTYHNKLYDPSILCFDIETTSAFLSKTGVPTPFKDHTRDEYEDADKVGVCYLWQFLFEGDAFYGRKLEDFLIILNQLTECDCYFIIYVHNLSFEFQWLLNILTFDTVFAKNTRRPIYATYKNIEFRCSFMLTRLSLANWAKIKKLPVKKLTGYLDYSKIRTPLTPLIADEMAYGEADVLIMYEGLKQYRERFGSVPNIPLTQTGIVRREVKNFFQKDMRYLKKISNLYPRSADEYLLFKLLFTGGYVHASWMYVDKVLEGVHSYDKASSYPGSMVVEKYPMTPLRKCDNPLKYVTSSRHCVIMIIKFYGLLSRFSMTWLSYSKCISSKGAVLDNGRVLSADEVTVCLNEVDYDCFLKMYSFEKQEVIEGWFCLKNYLPKRYVEYVLSLYGKKTQMKGTEAEDNGEYANFKENINSLYGMCVTAILNTDVEFKDGEWAEKPFSKEGMEDALLKRKSDVRKNFLHFLWGVWVTSYGRQSVCEVDAQAGDLTVYNDTDSVKSVEEIDDIIADYNGRQIEKIKKVASDRGIDVSFFMPEDKNGVPHPIGVFEKECVYERFKTLGSKRYMAQVNGKISITCSGVNKTTALNEIKDFEDFKAGKTVTAENSGRLTLCYRSDQPPVVWPDGYCSENAYSIPAYNSDFTFNRDADFKRLIALVKERTRDTPVMTAAEIYDLLRKD